jgi:hypothetical protein
MKKLLLFFVFILMLLNVSSVFAESPPPFIMGGSLPQCTQNGYVLTYSTSTHKYSCEVVSGTAANPGGTENQIQYNSAGTAFAGFTMSGDCTLVVATGVITCTKSGNVAFGTGAFATIANYAPLASPTFTGTVGGITKAMVGLTNVTDDVQTKAAVVPNTAPATGGMLIGNAGGTAYAPVAMSGDATIAATGAITVAKFGGTAFGSAAGHAATDFALSSITVNGHAISSNVTVSASDLTTGTLPHAQLPTLLSGDIPSITSGETYLLNLSASSPATGLRYGIELPTWIDVVPSAGYPITYDHASKSLKFYDDGWNTIGSSGAPVDASYLTLGTNGTLTSERVLTMGTSMATPTDGGAGSTYTINTIQDIRTTATPQFARLGIGLAADGTQFLKIGTGSDYATISSTGVLAFAGAGGITGYQTTITRPVTAPSSPTTNGLVKFTGSGYATDNAGAILGTLTDGYYCKYASSGTLISCNTQYTTASNFIFGSDARGDIAIRGASAYGRLAKGTAYSVLQMNSGATDPQWSTFTINDGTTNAFTIANGTGSLAIGAARALSLSGTFTNTYLCNYTSSGTVIGCNVNPATFQTAHAALTSIAGLTETAGGLPYMTADNTYAVLAAGTQGKILQMGASNPGWSSATWPTAATSGTLIRGNGTNYLETTLTMPTTIAAGSIFAANTANTLSAITSTSGTYYLSNTNGTVAWSAPSGTGDLKADGTIPLTANWNMGNYTITVGGVIVAKTSGTAGSMKAYEANSTDTDGIGWMGPASISASHLYQFSNTAPSAGQVMAFAAPTGTGGPGGEAVSAQTWIIPALSASYANQVTINAITSGGIAYGSAANTISSTAALTQYGVLIGGGSGSGPSALTVGATNQVLRGSTGGSPSFGSLAVTDLPTVTASKGGTGVANNDLNTITFAGGNYSMTFTLNGNTNVTFPASGTLSTLTAPIALASQASGDIFYATSGTAIARLAKGTANQVLQMNSGATTPEWTSMSWIDSSAYATLALADAAAVSADKPLWITQDYTLTGNTTLSSHVYVVKGNIITTTGYSISAPNLTAGRYQIFAGTGTVTNLKEAYPEWFGIIPDGTLKNGSLLNTAIAATMGGELKFGAGTYLIGTTAVTVANSGTQGFTMSGVGPHSTILITPKTGDTGALESGSFITWNCTGPGTNIIDMAIIADTGGNFNIDGLTITGSNGVTADNIWLSSFHENMKIAASSSNNKISKIESEQGTIGLTVSASDMNTFSDIHTYRNTSCGIYNIGTPTLPYSGVAQGNVFNNLSLFEDGFGGDGTGASFYNESPVPYAINNIMASSYGDSLFPYTGIYNNTGHVFGSVSNPVITMASRYGIRHLAGTVVVNGGIINKVGYYNQTSPWATYGIYGGGAALQLKISGTKINSEGAAVHSAALWTELDGITAFDCNSGGSTGSVNSTTGIYSVVFDPQSTESRFKLINSHFYTSNGTGKTALRFNATATPSGAGFVKIYGNDSSYDGTDFAAKFSSAIDSANLLTYDWSNNRGFITTYDTYQPIDSDLTAIAALTCTENQIIKRNGAGAWVCAADETGTGESTGDVASVGDCTEGACLDGSSDGGTYVRLYDGTSAYTGITAGVRTLTFAPSNANAENLIMTFGDNSNVVALSSGTGALVNISGSAASITGTLANIAASTSANLYGVLSDEVGSGYAVFNTAPTFVTSIAPTTAGTATIGTTALEWGNVYLTDGAVIYGQADQSNSITSSATGWTFNQPITLGNQTTTAGSIYFQEGSGGGTNKVRLQGPASTADVTLTLPAVTDTIATIGTAQTFTGTQTFATDIILTSATAGARITGGNGLITFKGEGDGTDEDLTINLNSANVATVSSSTGVTALNISALNLITTGIVSGGINISSDADGMTAANMIAADLSTTGLYGTMFIATGAGTWILPDVASAGQSACLMDSGTAHDLILDVTAGSTIRLKGTEQADGVGITNAAGSTTGDFVCVISVAAHKWSTVGMGGTWASQ